VGSFEVGHRRAREVKYFEKPLQRDEMYDRVVVIRLQIQRVPARTSETPANFRVGGRSVWSESLAARFHAWRPALRCVWIACLVAIVLTASKDFVSCSSLEIWSGDDEKMATILESSARTDCRGVP